MECRVDLGINIWKKREKIHILGIFRGHVPVHPSRTEHVPVHVRHVPVHPAPFRPVFVF